jgi:hypothetical protein
LGERLKGLSGEGLYSIGVGGGDGAIEGNFASALGDLDGRVFTLAGAIDGDGDFLLTDDVLLALGVRHEVDPGDGKGTCGSLGGDDAGNWSPGQAKGVSCGERHFGVLCGMCLRSWFRCSRPHGEGWEWARQRKQGLKNQFESEGEEEEELCGLEDVLGKEE